MEPGHRLAVDFDHMEVEFLFPNEILGQHTHAGTYLYDIGRAAGETVDDALSDALVGEKMLTEELFSFYFIHLAFNALYRFRARSE